MDKILEKDVQWIQKYEAPNSILQVRFYRTGKRIFDLLITILISPIWLSMLGIIALSIKMNSPDGPAIIQPLRRGRSSKVFSVYKFRITYPDVVEWEENYTRINELTWPKIDIADDPRVLPIGRLLIKRGLLHLPQFINVLKGEMSLVGPRLLGPEGNNTWREVYPDTLPGMTGLAQMFFRRRESDYRVHFDIFYIEHATFLLDLRLLFMSIMDFLQDSGHRALLYRTEYSIGVQEYESAHVNHDTTHNDPKKILKQVLDEIGKKNFRVSISHPKLISKRFESPFIVLLYFEELANNVKIRIKQLIGESYTEHVYDTQRRFGEIVKVKLFSPDITFPDAISRKLDASVNALTFLGKPSDTCEPGVHRIVLSILDSATGIEYQSEVFSIKVVDFAFDHVSRPLLSRISTLLLSIGSSAMFILTFLEQIDKTFGFTSGAVAGVLAIAIYTNFYNSYQRIRPNTS